MEAFNSQVLDALLSARNLSFEAISQRIGRSDQDVRNEIYRDSGPSQGLINDLSTELSVPSFVFFMDEAPHLEEAIVDFRLENPSYQPKSRATIESIEMARDLQSLAERLQHADTLERDVDLETVRSPDYAAGLRDRLGISLAAQIECRDPGVFYALCRSAIERQGVFVLHESFPAEDGSGFCLALSSARLITVNTLRQNRSRRNFTLAHELAHALVRQTGISDPFITRNYIERSCNLFAAQFLIPRPLAEQAYARFQIGRSPTVQSIARTANYLNVSQQATVVRFEQIGLVEEGSHDKWLSAVQENGNPDWVSKGGGSGNTPQEKVKLAKYGLTFAKVFGSALNNGALSQLDIYRVSGLKAKYQRPYFSFANSAEPAYADD